MENYLNMAAQIITGTIKPVKEPTCIDCGTVLFEAEEEEGRCARCSFINAEDIYRTGVHPDARCA